MIRKPADWPDGKPWDAGMHTSNLNEPAETPRLIVQCFDDRRAGQECPLPGPCEAGNRCVVAELRARGWAVIPPIPGSERVPLLPAGVIHDGSDPLSPPDPSPGWLRCRGDLLRRDEYPKLFEAIDTRYNHGGETPDTFRLPDWRPRDIWIYTGGASGGGGA